jgi:hypothetical protein
MMRHLIDLIESVDEIVWHGSPDNFDITQAGPMTHFGSKKSAAHRIHTKRAELTLGRPRSITTGYLFPVRLAIHKPLTINDRQGLSHTPYKLTDMLHYDLKAISSDERTEIMAEQCRFEKIAEVLSRHGYDGFAYTNAVEDPGHTSYVTFHPGQIKPAGPTETYVQHGAFNGNLVESVAMTPTQAVCALRDEWIAEQNTTAYAINRGQCFEFADALEEAYPDLFVSIEIGNIFRYEGKYNDDPVGFDEALIAQHWPNIKPYPGLTWEQMFQDCDLSWPGTHGWAFCAQTGLSYDVETPEGVSNPFDLPFFDSYKAHGAKVLAAKPVTEEFMGGFEVNSIYGPQVVEVYHNPSRKEFDTIRAQHKAVRGFIDADIYIWDAHLADHGMVGNKFNMSGLHAEWRDDGYLIINWNDSWNGAYGYDDFDHVKRSIEENPRMKRLLIGFEVVRS